MSPADIENIVNEAIIHAVNNNKNLAGMDDIEYAKDRILMGTQKVNA